MDDDSLQKVISELTWEWCGGHDGVEGAKEMCECCLLADRLSALRKRLLKEADGVKDWIGAADVRDREIVAALRSIAGGEPE